MIDSFSQTVDVNKTLAETPVESALLANRYRVVRQLGQGGMGSVWLAEDVQRKGKQVAIKMLPSILVKNKKAVKQLREEAEHWEKLSHPNIATLRMYEENAGNPFLVVDFIDGETLEDYLAAKGRLSEGEAVKILAPIAQALDYAHEQGVIHRDVKPANIMVRKDGKPFVLDFGIARELHETMTRVTGALSSGTLMYMSPEQLHGAEPDPKQDIYAFAAMAYECLTGVPPFSRGQIEYQIEHDQPKLLPQSISIAPFVMSGLSKMAADRPSSCCSIVGQGLSASKPNLCPAKRGFGRMFFAISGGVLLALAGACVFLLGRNDGAAVVNPLTPIETKHDIITRPVVVPQVIAPVVVETQIVEKIVTPRPKTEIDEQPAPALYGPSGKQLLDKWLRGDFNAVQKMLEGIPDEIQDSNPDVLFVRGQMLGLGICETMDREEADELYLKSRRAGSLLGKAACFFRKTQKAVCGNVLQNVRNFSDRFTPQNELLQELERNARQGDVGAMLWLGNLLAINNASGAWDWWKAAHDRGSFQAGVNLLRDVAMSANQVEAKKAMKGLERFATQGVWYADLALVQKYVMLNDVGNARRCYERSCDKIEIAAEEGDAAAKKVSAMMSEDGDSVFENQQRWEQQFNGFPW